MYFPIGWPKLVDTSATGTIRQICCDRVKILLAVLSDDFLGIWYTKPLVPIAYQQRSKKSLEKEGSNKLLAWKPDSGMIVVATDTGYLKFYSLEVIESQKGVFNQVDPPLQNLRRDSAELFIKEIIPSLLLKPAFTMPLYVEVNSIACVSAYQIMVATKSEKILKLKWNGAEERDYTIDLKRTPFSINQQVSYAVPITEANTFVTCLEYSPLVGGFAITLNDGRAAFLTAPSLKFDPNQVQGVWAPTIEDATCCSINHKFRLIAFGQKNSQASVYTIEDSVGGLELSHKLVLSPKDFPGLPGHVNDMKWTPDGCAIAMSWANGGISVWSTFGAMLMCSLGWDYGVHTDLSKNNPLNIIGMEWSTEGYQLFLLKKAHSLETSVENGNTDSDYDSPSENGELNMSSTKILQLDFVKSTLTVNPCMATHSHILLQGDDKLYISQGNSLEKIYLNSKGFIPGNQTTDLGINNLWKGDDNLEIGKQINVTSMLGESKHWTVIQLPVAYGSTNWPIRYTAIDKDGVNLAVAGRTGLAHYSIANRKWKLFGNETQEKDFVVTGGLLWWNDFIVMGCFSLVDHCDEIRVYPKECKLDNRFGHRFEVKAPVMLINMFKDQLVVLSADGIVSTYGLSALNSTSIEIQYLYEVDIRSVCTHSACIVSLSVTNLKHETATKTVSQATAVSETIVLNVSGRILMILRENNSNSAVPVNSTCLASCVECIWLSTSERSHMKESLWLFCGIHGMRVWLPVLPCEDDVQRTYRHTFMSKRIMLSFSLKVYPLAILFEDVIIVGVENDTVLYTSDANSHFSIPFSILERKSQVYLHQILRQLIRRNLGYNAWEIARCCTNLPYFPHSLELLLHEVLEDEATSKEPIPDALLPSVLEFIQEFPVYLQTIVQCARKTEIALWHYLFATAGKPKELFQQCLSVSQLETAASYLIILQNLEPSAVSRQYATLLLDTALENKKWELAKDLVRFLRAIDPNDVESPRNSFTSSKFGCPPLTQIISPDAEDLSLILGTMTRGRSFSTTITPKAQQNTQQSTQGAKERTSSVSNTGEVQRRKKSMPTNTTKEKNSSSAEDFFIEVILQRHARRLLQEKKLEDLGKMSAALDFHLVGWLARENDRAARIEDFVSVLKQLHTDLDWPKPNSDLSMEDIETKGQQESPCLSLDCSTQVNNISAIESGYSSLPNFTNSNLTNTTDIAKYNLIRTNSISNTIPSTLPCINEEYASVKIDTKTIASSKATDLNSICSNETSIFSTDLPLTGSTDMYYSLPSIEYRKRRERIVPHKLEVKIRYLLQIFTEANCLEYSLVLSILLLDAASISRITNTAIRSGSLPACRQIRNALKDITRWSFHECFGYRTFMMKLQPQISLLDQFVIQQESIPFIQPEKQMTIMNENTDRTHEVRTMGNSAILLDSEDSIGNDRTVVQAADLYPETKISAIPKLSHSTSLDETLLSHMKDDEKRANCVVM